MTEDLTKHPDFPKILLAESRERFNRRTKVWTTIAMFILLGIMLWAGYQNYSVHKQIGTNYCYACGYYEGKSCNAVYFQPETLYNSTLKEEARRQLAEYNARKEPLIKDEFTGRMTENLTNFTFNLK